MLTLTSPLPIRGLQMLTRKKRKKTQTVEEMERDLQARMLMGNQQLQEQMARQQERDVFQTMELQREQGKLLRKLMGD